MVVKIIQRILKVNKHLKDQEVGYFEHWWRAIKMSGALFIHAWLPDVLKDYASKELSK